MADQEPQGPINRDNPAVVRDLVEAQPREIGEAPQPASLPRPGNPSVLAALAQRQYVSSGAFSPALAAFYKTLARLADEIEQQFGEDVYDRMMQDATVTASVHLLKQSVIEQEIAVSPVLEDHDANYDKAKELADFCQRCLDRLPHFRTGTLYELMDALKYGHRLAEMTYELETIGPDKGKLVPKSVMVKPRNRYAFLVDSYMNVTGILGVIPGKAPWLLSGVIVGDPAQLPNLLPRSKFVVLSLLQKEGDPRGSSWLRAAYQPYWLKQQIWPEYLKYLLQFAGPSLVGETAPNVQKTPKLNADGTPVLDGNGLPIFIDPEAELSNALLNFRNSTVLAVPNGTKITPLFAYGDDGAAFRAGVESLDAQISRAILYQTLATQEGKHESRAASQVHQDMMRRPIQYLRTAVEEMIRRDMFANWVRYNYGEEWLQWTPQAALGDTEQENFDKNATAYAALMTAGFLDPSQLRAIDSQLGLPARSQEDVDARIAKAQAGTQMQVAQAGHTQIQAEGAKQQQQHSDDNHKLLMQNGGVPPAVAAAQKQAAQQAQQAPGGNGAPPAVPAGAKPAASANGNGRSRFSEAEIDGRGARNGKEGVAI